MKKAPAVAISVHAIAMALLLASWSALGQPADPAQWYASIQDLIGRDRKTGVSGTDRRSLDQFGERLASGGDPAIVFVVRKLRRMNDAEKILRVLTESYSLVIACDPHGGRMVLDLAFVRIGLDSMASLLQIGGSPLEPVRCAADELTNSLGEHARLPSGLSRPKMLDCKAEPELQIRQLAESRKWWRENAPRVELPKFTVEP